MACSIQFNNLINGQEISLPYRVTGRITVLPNVLTGSFTAASRQIDSNPVVSMAGCCVPAPGPLVPGPSDFTFDLTATDCPLPSVQYTLNIYAWDNLSQAVTLASVIFKTASVSPPTPTPPRNPRG